MNSEKLNKLAEFAITDYQMNTEQEMKRRVLSVLHEVEREVRHEAMSKAYKLAEEINNMRNDK